jgi:hypothetical protein
MTLHEGSVMLIDREEAAKRLCVSELSLLSKPYRMRLQLPAVKIGRRLCFDEADVEKVIRKGKERLPLMVERERQ